MRTTTSVQRPVAGGDIAYGAVLAGGTGQMGNTEVVTVSTAGRLSVLIRRLLLPGCGWFAALPVA